MSYVVLDRFQTYEEVTESDLRDALDGRVDLDVQHVHAAVEAGSTYRPLAERAIESDDPELILAGSAAVVGYRDEQLAQQLQQVLDTVVDPIKRLRAEAAIIYAVASDRGLGHLDGENDLTYFLASNLLLVKNFDTQDIIFTLGLLRLLSEDLSFRQEKQGWNETAADCINALLGAGQQDAIEPAFKQQVAYGLDRLVEDPLFAPDAAARQELAALRQLL